MLSNFDYIRRLQLLRCFHRNYASSAREKRLLYEHQRKKKVEEKAVYERGLPEITTVIKQMWMKVHPDKLNAYTLLRDTNADSMKKLNGLIQYIIAPQSEYHRAELIKLKFYVIQESSPTVQASDTNSIAPMRVREVESSIELNGSDCRKGIKKQLISLFSKCNLDSVKDFRWPKTAWHVDWKRGLDDGKKKSDEDDSSDNRQKQLPASTKV